VCVFFPDEYDKHPNEVLKNEELTYNTNGGSSSWRCSIPLVVALAWTQLALLLAPPPRRWARRAGHRATTFWAKERERSRASACVDEQKKRSAPGGGEQRLQANLVHPSKIKARFERKKKLFRISPHDDEKRLWVWPIFQNGPTREINSDTHFEEERRWLLLLLNIWTTPRTNSVEEIFK
jgi:hypothetical protein